MSLAGEILGAVVGLTGRDYLIGSDLLAADLVPSPPAAPVPPKKPRFRRRRRRRGNAIERLIRQFPPDVREQVIGELMAPTLPVEAIGLMTTQQQNELMDSIPIESPLDSIFGTKNEREEEPSNG